MIGCFFGCFKIEAEQVPPQPSPQRIVVSEPALAALESMESLRDPTDPITRLPTPTPPSVTTSSLRVRHQRAKVELARLKQIKALKEQQRQKAYQHNPFLVPQDEVDPLDIQIGFIRERHRALRKFSQDL